MTVKKVRSNLPAIIAKYEADTGTRLTQVQIADDTGIQQPTISVWMSDKQMKRIDADVLLALCDYFGITFNDLLKIEETADPEATAPTNMIGARALAQ